MIINANEVINSIGRFKNGIDYTFGYARISEYEKALPETYTVTPDFKM